MEASQEITGNAAATTGLTTLPFSNEIGKLSQRREGLIDRAGRSLADQEGVQKQTEELIGQRGKELEKPRSDLIERSRKAPDLDAHEETVKDFQRPQMDPREFKEIFGILMASSMPWYAAMGAIQGSMQGFMQADGEYVKEQMAVYTKNVEAIKTRNEQKRHDVDVAWKKYSNDLDQLRREYELIAAKYDDPLALLASRSKSIVEAQKLIDNNIKSIDGAVDKLLVAGATQTANAARLEEARARRTEAAARFQESSAFRYEQAARRATDRDEKLTRDRFKDIQSLRKEYNTDVKPLVGDLGKVDRILAYADNPGAFSDNQLRQAVTEFQKGARGTNAMVASLMNFGTLDERVAGTFNRFFEGEYTPTQRQDVKELFTMLKNQVLAPGLEERKTRYRWLATQNRLDPDQVVAGEESPPGPAAAPAPAAPGPAAPAGSAANGAPGFGPVVPR